MCCSKALFASLLLVVKVVTSQYVENVQYSQSEVINTNGLGGNKFVIPAVVTPVTQSYESSPYSPAGGYGYGYGSVYPYYPGGLAYDDDDISPLIFLLLASRLGGCGGFGGCGGNCGGSCGGNCGGNCGGSCGGSCGGGYYGGGYNGNCGCGGYGNCGCGGNYGGYSSGQVYIQQQPHIGPHVPIPTTFSSYPEFQKGGEISLCVS